MYHSQIRIIEMDIFIPVRKTFIMFVYITYIHRTQESRNTKNTYDFFVQVRNFLLPLSLKVLRHKERDTHSFYSGFSICSPTQHVWHPPQRPLAGLRRASESQPTFSKSSKSSTHALPVHDVIHIRWSTFLSEFYFDICERHILPARALTPALKFAPNPCAEPKGPQPNKTQRHKTKYLGHYITNIFFRFFNDFWKKFRQKLMFGG